jgi:selenide, water dikinase
LAQVLRLIPNVTDKNVLVDLATSDDAAVYRVTDDLAVVLTVDFFTPVVDDAYEFGRIAVTNALSDVYAMGGTPVIGLNLVAYPARTRPLDKLEDILRGGADQAAAAGVSIVGGHSIDDEEPKYGLVAMGVIDPNKIVTNAGAKPGDRLVLTKPIGTGIITTAIKRDAASDDVVRRAVQVMTTLNASAAEAMLSAGAHACTDITGFGLLGHLIEMTHASCVGAQIGLSDVPLMEGVRELLAQDMAPGGTYANLDYVNQQGAICWPDAITEEEQLLLCDAQTAGGLLIAVSPERADQLIADLKARGTLAASDIGEIVDDRSCGVRIR